MISMASNIASLRAQRQLGATQDRLINNIRKLSSGFRINRAADDASGLAISDQIRAHMKGLKQAQRNANDGISLIQTAEGGLGEVVGLIHRMRELAVQAGNEGTMDSTERGYLNQEFSLLESELNRIVNVTEYNGQQLINGAISSGISFQVGMRNSSNDQISLTLTNMNATSLGLNDDSLSSSTNAQKAISALDTALESINTQRGSLGASQNRLTMSISNLGTMYDNLAAADSRIRDVDVAEETAFLTRNQILSQAGTSVLAQANQIPQTALALISG